jgi:hypothetical protein
MGLVALEQRSVDAPDDVALRPVLLAWRRFTSTPEPVETGSTWMPDSFPKAAKTRSFSVLSFAE